MVVGSLNDEWFQRGGGGGGEYERTDKVSGRGNRRFYRDDIRRGSGGSYFKGVWEEGGVVVTAEEEA